MEAEKPRNNLWVYLLENGWPNCLSANGLETTKIVTVSTTAAVAAPALQRGHATPTTAALGPELEH